MQAIISAACLLPSLLLFVPTPSSAATQPQEILLCRDSVSSDAQIACLEDAVRKLTGLQTEDSTIVASSTAGETDTAPAPTVAEPESQRGSILAATALPPPSSAAPRAAPDVDTEAEQISPANRLDTLGDERLRSDARDKDSGVRVQAKVTSFAFVGRNKLRVMLANGQVWQQSNSDRPNLETSLRQVDTFDVELWRTSHGGYRMFVPLANRILRVDRKR